MLLQNGISLEYPLCAWRYIQRSTMSNLFSTMKSSRSETRTTEEQFIDSQVTPYQRQHIQRILQSRQTSKGTQFLIKWKSESWGTSWEPALNLAGLDFLISKFKRNRKRNAKMAARAKAAGIAQARAQAQQVSQKKVLTSGEINSQKILNNQAAKNYSPQCITIEIPNGGAPVQMVKFQSYHYQVATILNSKRKDGIKWYKIKWVGWDECSWEPIENLTYVTAMVQAYEQAALKQKMIKITHRPKIRRPNKNLSPSQRHQSIMHPATPKSQIKLITEDAPPTSQGLAYFDEDQPKQRDLLGKNCQQEDRQQDGNEMENRKQNLIFFFERKSEIENNLFREACSRDLIEDSQVDMIDGVEGSLI